MSAKSPERTFDTVAREYERLRPGYPDGLYRKLFDYAPLNGSSRAAEVGIGAGQASLPILRTGCGLTAIESGENFSEICAEKFRDYPKFSVITGRFEDMNFESGAFDLVYSATASTGYRKKSGTKRHFSC